MIKMNGWLSSTNRKRHQRAINQVVRKVNKLIEEDEKWQGRFYIHQTGAKWMVDEDGVGYFRVRLEFCDRKTNITHVIWSNVNHLRWINNSALLWEMNDFIVNKVKYWEEKA
jgi:hypothetical protein